MQRMRLKPKQNEVNTMMSPHEIYGCEMSARKALAMLRKTGQVGRMQARLLLSALDNGAIPLNLAPLCDKVYLMQLAPANELPL